jgi:hypothetical protein
MTFDVKDGRYRQDTIRVNGKVVSIYRGKTGKTERIMRPTRLDKVAGDQINRINEKIAKLYNQGYGDRKIAKILCEEDQLENPPGSIGGGGGPFNYNVIKTQRGRIGVADRVHKPKEIEPDWKAMVVEQKQQIKELNWMLQSTMDERDRYIQRHEECMQENYAMKYPGV